MQEHASAARTGSEKPLQRPPILAGYTYEPAEAYRARDEARLLAIRLETNHSCNLRCRYCYAASGAEADVVDIDTLLMVVSQAARLGAQSIVVIGGGEPTLHPQFKRLVQEIAALGVTPVIFTNAMAVDRELAELFRDSGASVMVKLDSLREPVQDFLAGSTGAARRMRRGIESLLEAGLADQPDPHRLQLGASFVSCRMNLEEIEDIWSYCRRHNIFPNMEVLTPTGRAKEQLPGQGLETREIQEYKLRLLDIDRDNYGFDWLPYTPLAASGCLQHLYSLYITTGGDVRPCAPTKFDEHPSLRVEGEYPYNIHRRSLGEIYHSPLFSYVRNIDRRLKGRCAGCEHNDECIGCRGYAYSVGVNEGREPLEALAGECLQCFK
jgi:MoaA/NifB/PqqE/SkfB family radical SAM enzyme